MILGLRKDSLPPRLRRHWKSVKSKSQRTDLLLGIISAVHELYRAEMQLRLSQGLWMQKRLLESTKQRESGWK